MSRKRISADYDRLLPAMAEEGMTLSEIEDHLEGRSRNAIRAAAARRGIPIMPDRSRSAYIAIIQDMPWHEAKDYLLDCIEVLSGVSSTETAKDRWGVEIPLLLVRLLAALDAHSGRTVTREALFEAMYFDILNEGGPDLVNVTRNIHRLREVLPPDYGVIHTERGVGYWLEKKRSSRDGAGI